MAAAARRELRYLIPTISGASRNPSRQAGKSDGWGRLIYQPRGQDAAVAEFGSDQVNGLRQNAITVGFLAPLVGQLEQGQLVGRGVGDERGQRDANEPRGNPAFLAKLG